jgi:regulator of sirC expression with transglutaminase-like and TPR domain
VLLGVLLSSREREGRTPYIFTGISGALALGITVNQLADLRSLDGVSIRWGIVMMLAASAALTVLSAAAAATAPPPVHHHTRPQDVLFFERLRRRAKWVFAFLALVFAGTFVFLGVGSGSSGIGDLLQENVGSLLGNDAGGTPSARRAQKQIAEHPNAPAGYRALSQAYVTDNKPDEAIPPLEKYLSLRPKDEDALLELASLYTGKAQRLQAEAQAAQAGAQTVQPTAALVLGSASTLGQTLAQDPIAQALSTAANEKVTAAYTKAQQAFRQVTSAFTRIATLRPDDPSAWVQLGLAAQQAADYPAAIRAFERFLKLAPDDPSAPQVKQNLKQLRQYVTAQQAQASAGASG